MTRRALLLSLVALGALGASSRRRYLRVHRDFTRELVLYQHFATALSMTATLLEPEFRAAMAAERARLLNPSAEDQAAFVDRMKRDGAAYHEIVFTADSAFDNAEKFGPGDDRWQVRLIVDGVEARLIVVDLVRRPGPLHDALYPQIDQWSALWIARFARVTPSPRQVTLIVGSGLGNGELSWDLDPAPALVTGR